MRTDDLIRSLAADRARGPAPARRLLVALTMALTLSLAGGLLLLGPRPDLISALTGPPVVKTLLPLLLGVLALVLAMRRARPAASAGGLDLALVGVLALLGVTLAGGVIIQGTAALVATLAEGNLARALISIPLLAIAPLAAMLWALSAGAPLAPARVGALAGLAAGSMAATVYSLSCPEDAAQFFVPVYGLAIGLVALAGAALGNRLLRW